MTRKEIVIWLTPLLLSAGLLVYALHVMQGMVNSVTTMPTIPSEECPYRMPDAGRGTNL